VILTLDGLEAFRFNIEDLAGSNEFALDSSLLFGDFPIRIGSTDSHFILDFGTFPAHFLDSVDISARRTGGTMDQRGTLVIYREKVLV